MRTRAPWLLTAALLTTGSCSAHDVSLPQLPATSALPSQSIPITPSAEALPPSLQGQWLPVSKALENSGPLSLNAHDLLWPLCGDTPRPIKAENTDPGVLLTLDTACQLDGHVITHLRLTPRANQPCKLELSLYENPSQLALHQRLAWGIYQRQGCTP